MKYQRIYDRMPLLGQHAMATLYGYKNKRVRFGGEYRPRLEFLRAFASLDRAEQEEYQRRELQAFVAHAATRSAFYRRLYAGVPWQKVRRVEDLALLPVVTKEQIRSNIEDVITVERSKGVRSQTGGTTGTSLEVWFTQRDYQHRMANLDHFKSLHGFHHLSMRRATFSGKHIVPQGHRTRVFWRYNHAMRQMLYSTFHLTPDNMPRYLESLEEFRPHSLDGFLSALYDVARYITRNRVELTWRPIAVFPTSETVTQAHRVAIREAFGCELRDQYASSEGAPFVYECREGRLHYDLSSGVIEPDPETGEILVTSFTTYGTPLVRYAIGDRMRFADPDEVCRCGNNMPLVAEIDGRVAECLLATNGTRINLGSVANLFKKAKNTILQAQVIQEDLARMVIKVVAEEAAREQVSALLREEVRHKFGHDMQLSIEFVPDIPREPNGKYRLAINRIPTGDPGAA